MKKIREVFEYEVETDDMEEVFTVQNYVDCVDDMCCPFWDGYQPPQNVKHTLEILE